ncbi:hypothetical protein [Streptomyces sp. NPDC093568]|uniref:hypothetical protein n=1 Tax=Streptomyces sp. NPDC093568 TaxID=3366041 RepID=UPI00380C4999
MRASLVSAVGLRIPAAAIGVPADIRRYPALLRAGRSGRSGDGRRGAVGVARHVHRPRHPAHARADDTC